MLICYKRKVLMLGWWLVLIWYERKVLLVGWLTSQTNRVSTVVDTVKIMGQPKSTLESVNAVTTGWGKQSKRSPFTSYVEKLTWPN